MFIDFVFGMFDTIPRFFFIFAALPTFFCNRDHLSRKMCSLSKTQSTGSDMEGATSSMVMVPAMWCAPRGRSVVVNFPLWLDWYRRASDKVYQVAREMFDGNTLFMRYLTILNRKLVRSEAKSAGMGQDVCRPHYSRASIIQYMWSENIFIYCLL